MVEVQSHMTSILAFQHQTRSEHATVDKKDADGQDPFRVSSAKRPCFMCCIKLIQFTFIVYGHLIN